MQPAVSTLMRFQWLCSNYCCGDARSVEPSAVVSSVYTLLTRKMF